jgi:hypothetical protein
LVAKSKHLVAKSRNLGYKDVLKFNENEMMVFTTEGFFLFKNEKFQWFISVKNFFYNNQDDDQISFNGNYVIRVRKES